MNKSFLNTINPATEFSLAACSLDQEIDLNEFCVASLLSDLKASDGKTGDGVWIQLLPAGKVVPRDARGDWVSGDLESLQSIVERSLEYLGASKMPIDYEHQILRSAKNGKPAPAAGWVKKLEAREDGIWGLVEWTANAATGIKAGEYKYISPVFTHEKTKDNKGGKIHILINAALTNSPALDMAEVSANSIAQLTNQNKGNETMLKDILKKLGLDANTTSQVALSAIENLQAQSTALTTIATALNVEDNAEPKAVEDALTALTSSMSDISAAVGLEDNADATAALSAVKTTVAAAQAKGTKDAKPDPAKFVPVADVVALQTQLNELTASLSTDKATARVDALVEAGKIAPVLRDYYIEQCSSNPEAFEQFEKNAPALTKSQLTNPADLNKDNVAQLSTEDEAVRQQLGLSVEDFVKAQAAVSAA